MGDPIPKLPRVSVISHGLMTWMIWDTWIGHLHMSWELLGIFTYIYHTSIYPYVIYSEFSHEKHVIFHSYVSLPEGSLFEYVI